MARPNNLAQSTNQFTQLQQNTLDLLLLISPNLSVHNTTSHSHSHSHTPTHHLTLTLSCTHHLTLTLTCTHHPTMTLSRTHQLTLTLRCTHQLTLTLALTLTHHGGASKSTKVHDMTRFGNIQRRNIERIKKERDDSHARVGRVWEEMKQADRLSRWQPHNQMAQGGNAPPPPPGPTRRALVGVKPPPLFLGREAQKNRN